jgi:hypothetical protein
MKIKTAEYVKPRATLRLAKKKDVAATPGLVQVRNSGILEDKAFWLNDNVNWILARDDEGQLCLIPRKKGV